MKFRSMTFRAVALCAALCAASVAHADLLVNGSFESGSFVNDGNHTMSLAAGSTTITGWTVVTDTTAWIGAGNPFGLTARDGSFFLDLTNYQAGGPFAGVTQTIATSVGATYLLSFDLGGSTFWGRPDALVASAAGSSALFTTGPASAATPNNDWYHETMQFVATSAQTAITLQGNAGNNYIGLDNVSVVLSADAPPPVAGVPEPHTWALMLAGLAAVGGATRCGMRANAAARR